MKMMKISKKLLVVDDFKYTCISLKYFSFSKVHININDLISGIFLIQYKKNRNIHKLCVFSYQLPCHLQAFQWLSTAFQVHQYQG